MRRSAVRVPDGAVEIVGVLRWPERAGLFVTPYSERQDLWIVRDHHAMAARYGWGDVAPFYIELESPAPPGGVPRPGPLTVKLRNDHLGYALTWFGLAAVLLLSTFGILGRRRPDDLVLRAGDLLELRDHVLRGVAPSGRSPAHGLAVDRAELQAHLVRPPR